MYPVVKVMLQKVLNLAFEYRKTYQLKN